MALITGGSSGLGLEIARELGGQGYRVLLMARGRERLDSAVSQLAGEGLDVRGFACDVTDEAGLHEVRDEVRGMCGGLDFLVLNAGVVSCGLLADCADTASMKRELDIDLWGTILTAHVFLPLLGRGSRILMISSGFGLMGAAGYTVYAAAKAGMINFAEALRRELLREGVSVHVACPGDMDTPQFHEEQRSMPGWMRSEAPRGMMHPRQAARKILAACRKGRFLVIINGEIRLLLIMGRLLPRRLRDAVLDMMFPRPPGRG